VWIENDQIFSADQSQQFAADIQLLADPFRHTHRKVGLLRQIDMTDPSIFYYYISDYFF
jgi:hypothetical protein